MQKLKWFCPMVALFIFGMAVQLAYELNTSKEGQQTGSLPANIVPVPATTPRTAPTAGPLLGTSVQPSDGVRAAAEVPKVVVDTQRPATPATAWSPMHPQKDSSFSGPTAHISPDLTGGDERKASVADASPGAGVAGTPVHEAAHTALQPGGDAVAPADAGVGRPSEPLSVSNGTDDDKRTSPGACETEVCGCLLCSAVKMRRGILKTATGGLRMGCRRPQYGATDA